MKYDKLTIMGLPKKFKVYYALDYLYPDDQLPDNPDHILHDEWPADGEEGEDAIFHVGQMDAAAILLHTVAVGIQREGRAVVAVAARLCAVHLHPADVGHDAGQQDLVIIRLCQKVVAAHFQRADDGIGIVQTGCEDDRAVVPAAQTLAEVHTVGVREKDVHLVGLSALMTTTLKSMEETIAALHAAKLDCKVMVGGAVLTPEYAEKIGADWYAKDAKQSADIAKKFFGES